jgi:hypothetical protein
VAVEVEGAEVGWAVAQGCPGVVVESTGAEGSNPLVAQVAVVEAEVQVVGRAAVEE